MPLTNFHMYSFILRVYWCWLNHETYQRASLRSKGRHDHTWPHLGRLSRTLAQWLLLRRLLTHCTAGPYLFPCCSPHIYACAQTFPTFIYRLLLFKYLIFPSPIAWYRLKRRKSNVIIPLAPFSFCLLFLLMVNQFRSQATYTHSESKPINHYYTAFSLGTFWSPESTLTLTVSFPLQFLPLFCTVC